MKAGNYGNLLVQIEQPRGEYAVTIAFLRLITTLVKVTFFKSYVIFQNVVLLLHYVYLFLS